MEVEAGAGQEQPQAGAAAAQGSNGTASLLKGAATAPAEQPHTQAGPPPDAPPPPPPAAAGDAAGDAAAAPAAGDAAPQAPDKAQENGSAGPGDGDGAAAAAAADDAADGVSGEDAAAAAAPAASASAAADAAPAGTAAPPAGAAARRPSSAAAAAAAAVAGANYGAAQPSLADLACQQGTPEYAAAARDNAQLLEEYNRLKTGYERVGQKKPDMVAVKDISKEAGLEGRGNKYGHVAGVAVGDVFRGRGELAVLGLHGQMMKGISCKKEAAHGAFAIVLSGGYKDDEDLGNDLWYTGAGGQEGKKQREDQTFEHTDNAQLLANHRSGTPVRVFRGTIAKEGANKGERLYAYEGLYQVVETRRVPSKDGPLVVQFKLEGLPGHSVVSAKVEYNSLNSKGGQFKKVQLAGAGRGAQPAAKRRIKVPSGGWCFNIPTAKAIRESIQSRAAAGRHGRLVTADLSNGKEKVPIPVWNALDDADGIPTMLEVPPDFPLAEAQEAGIATDSGFTYIADYTYGEEAAKEMAIMAERLFREAWPYTCGTQFHGRFEVLYNEEGLLMATDPSGIMECDPNCNGGPTCKGNQVVTAGMRYPLEVYKVPKKGWGVRCAVDVPVGAVLCCYIGNLITDQLAEMLRGMDAYLFDLNHFHQLLVPDADGDAGDDADDTANAAAASSPDAAGAGADRAAAAAVAAAAAGGGDGGGSGGGGGGSKTGGSRKRPAKRPPPDRDEVNPNLPPLHPDLREHHLVVDASHEGNVARFINHCCDPNCIVQTVFAKSCRSHLLHYIAVVAAEDIPAYTELTYNYSYMSEEDVEALAAADSGAGEPGDAARRRRVPCTCSAVNCKKWLLLH